MRRWINWNEIPIHPAAPPETSSLDHLNGQPCPTCRLMAKVMTKPLFNPELQKCLILPVSNE